MRRARALVACEFSGTVREELAKRGWDAWSCDLLPTERAGQHIIGDARVAIERHGPWDLLIAHPPCTYLANSANKHLYIDGDSANGRYLPRWRQLEEAADFFLYFLNCESIPFRAVENPVMGGAAQELIRGKVGKGFKLTQSVQPWMFGHMEVKHTCLWLRNLPKLVETHNVYDEMMRTMTRAQRSKVHFASPKKDRGKERSITLPGLAEAMAEQWTRAYVANWEKLYGKAS